MPSSPAIDVSNTPRTKLSQMLVDVDKNIYYFEGVGLRKVLPYDFAYQTFVKGRWVGKPILDVFANDFKMRAQEVHKRSIETGRIVVNGQKVEIDYVLKDGDKIVSYAHRHEYPVLDQPIEIIYEDDNLLVVNKPASFSVHPGGLFNYNCLFSVLELEMGYTDLHACNRLDRLTSGLMLVALNPTEARRVHKLMLEGTIRKKYVSRVCGNFPEGEIVVEQPIKVVARALGVNCVDPEGKKSLTTFKKLHFDGKTSLVECRPQTGRTHQIRVHLQYLGHPIANDPLYNPNFKPNEEIDCGYCEICDFHQTEPRIEDLFIYLHAMEYTVDGKSYSTKTLPKWASFDYDYS